MFIIFIYTLHLNHYIHKLTGIVIEKMGNKHILIAEQFGLILKNHDQCFQLLFF